MDAHIIFLAEGSDTEVVAMTMNRDDIFGDLDAVLAGFAEAFGRPGSYTLVTEDYETDSITHATRMGTTSLSTST